MSDQMAKDRGIRLFSQAQVERALMQIRRGLSHKEEVVAKDETK